MALPLLLRGAMALKNLRKAKTLRKVGRGLKKAEGPIIYGTLINELMNPEDPSVPVSDIDPVNIENVPGVKEIKGFTPREDLEHIQRYFPPNIENVEGVTEIPSRTPQYDKDPWPLARSKPITVTQNSPGKRAGHLLASAEKNQNYGAISDILSELKTQASPSPSVPVMRRERKKQGLMERLKNRYTKEKFDRYTIGRATKEGPKRQANATLWAKRRKENEALMRLADEREGRKQMRLDRIVHNQKMKLRELKANKPWKTHREVQQKINEIDNMESDILDVISNTKDEKYIEKLYKFLELFDFQRENWENELKKHEREMF